MTRQASQPSREREWAPPVDGGEKTVIVNRFTMFSDLLDQAGLGSANFLYMPLKWRLNRSRQKPIRFRRLFAYSLRHALISPARLPRGLRKAPIVMGSSYVVADRHQRRVAAHFMAEEILLCEAGPGPRTFAERIGDTIRGALAFGSSLYFAARVRAKLSRGGASEVESTTIARAALIHAFHRPVARAVLRRSRPNCVVIGNANRPFELSLWFEARKSGIPTVLLPYAELNLNLKPERLFSLCRAQFELALPFSEYSAIQLRRLRRDVPVVVAGYPDFHAEDTRRPGSPPASGESDCDVIYLGGSMIEPVAAPILEEALGNFPRVRLRVRPHPKMPQGVARQLYGWAMPDRASDPHRIDITDDIRTAKVVVTVRSTGMLDAISMGLPVVLIVPDAARDTMQRSPLLEQKLTLLEAANAVELRSRVQILLDDPSERQRVIDGQFLRLMELGYTNNYFSIVTASIRELAGLARADDRGRRAS